MTSIFHITGGLGKHILASSVINSYKNKFPEKDIIVSSAYPSVFERNPNVSESLNLTKHQYFYKNYIINKDVEIFAQEPYKQTSHITKAKHMIDTWCDMIGVENTMPSSIHLNFREIEHTRNKLNDYGDKPILVFQPFGGMIDHTQKYCWARDIHPELAQSIVNKLQDKYTIIHICNSTHPQLQNCIRMDDKLHSNIIFSILALSTKRILIDSCLQHAAYALNLPSLVIWNVTSPNQFGYSLHNNIVSHNEKLNGSSNSYLFNYEIGGIIDECPYQSYDDMFDIDTIMQYIDNNF
jgi:ADP-heptose:LPS heptosyltransferase